MALTQTFHFRSYPGEVHLLRATLFETGPHLPKDTDSKTMAIAYKRFLENADKWRKFQPGCHIHEIEANHATIIYTKAHLVNKVILETMK